MENPYRSRYRRNSRLSTAIIVRGGLFAGLVWMPTGPAAAQTEIKMMELANNLGGIIAAETMCGLELDQPAIEALIEKKVPATDIGFAGQLEMMISGNKVSQEGLSQSGRTAYCTQIKRSAKTLGLIKP